MEIPQVKQKFQNSLVIQCSTNLVEFKNDTVNSLQIDKGSTK